MAVLKCETSKLAREKQEVKIYAKLVTSEVLRFSMPVISVICLHPANQKAQVVGVTFEVKEFSKVACVTFGEYS